jgi:hypothetical protein
VKTSHRPTSDTCFLQPRLLFLLAFAATTTSRLRTIYSQSISPSIRILDHVVHLTRPGRIHETAEQFRELGFKSVQPLPHVRINNCLKDPFADQRHRRRHAYRRTNCQFTRCKIVHNSLHLRGSDRGTDPARRHVPRANILHTPRVTLPTLKPIPRHAAQPSVGE